MDMKNINTFIYTAELGSFTKAAELLGYSQSTVSFQIRQLEEELGTVLFERINRTVTLTDRGKEILRYAHRMKQLAGEMQEMVQPKQEVRGHLRIAMSDSLCEEIAEKLFVLLQRKYPEITMKIVIAGTDEMFRLLNQNQVDFVYTLDRHIYHSDYVIVTESREAVHFVTGYQNSLNGKKQIPLQELICQPFILTEKEMSYRRMLSEYLASCSLEIQPVFEVGNTELICRMLEKNASAISLLPDYVTEKAVQEKRLVRLDVKDFQLDIWKQLLYHRDKWISPQMQAFMNVIKEVQA
ncbi:LysR family transcriptional regulator [Lachnospiraceae bacterium CLA-AA-H246]|uniref:LysR family transcriptional regulator n=1 Tax=Hominisplanchenecus faecis TaxID=2885351 RepID=A0ABS8ETR3_9FIRM|nr:LysR family transcriptional regulator [Hominisplanchenecus faecis]MCC2148577.1 LysR family transcriptional regulator [Hominisplanchenecus faecis]